MLTVVKFFFNPNPRSANRLISRTLMKIAVPEAPAREASNTIRDSGRIIVSGHRDPGSEEFWLVELVRETQHGPSGVFLLRPIRKLDQVLRLLPNQFTAENRDGIIIVSPTLSREDAFYTLPIQLRRKLSGINTGNPSAYAVIVNHGGSEWSD